MRRWERRNKDGRKALQNNLRGFRYILVPVLWARQKIFKNMCSLFVNFSIYLRFEKVYEGSPDQGKNDPGFCSKP